MADDGSIVAVDRRKTPRGEPTPEIIPIMLKELLGSVPDGMAAPGRAVIGVPGIIDIETEQLLAAPNIPQSWIGFLSEAWLEERTGLAVALANDADLAAVGESTFGAGEPYRDVAYVTISTGVGAGVVVADKLVRARLSGGELGHTVIDRVALAEGGPSTVEELGSGTAIHRAAAAAGLEAQGADLAQLVRDGDPVASGIWTEAIGAVGVGIANLAWIVAPQIVVIGGGVGRNEDLVVPLLRDRIDRFGPKTGGTIEVAVATLGDDAALVGAAAWWKAVGRG